MLKRLAGHLIVAGHHAAETSAFGWLATRREAVGELAAEIETPFPELAMELALRLGPLLPARARVSGLAGADQSSAPARPGGRGIRKPRSSSSSTGSSPSSQLDDDDGAERSLRDDRRDGTRARRRGNGASRARPARQTCTRTQEGSRTPLSFQTTALARHREAGERQGEARALGDRRQHARTSRPLPGSESIRTFRLSSYSRRSATPTALH